MIRSLNFFLLISLVNSATKWTTNEPHNFDFFGTNSSDNLNTSAEISTTRKWTRKKPAYWEFPETVPPEKPDVSAEYCKSVDMAELGGNITKIVTTPVRGHSEPLLNAVILYVLTLHRFIRKCNTTDDIAKRMARELIEKERPKFMDMKIDMPFIKMRVGFDPYELQHFQWVLEDIEQSWEELKEIILGTKPKEKIKTTTEHEM